MRKLTVPYPPAELARPDYTPIAKFRAITDWMDRTKGQVEGAVNENASATGTHITLGTFSTSTIFSGTDLTGNVLCTLITILQAKGILA